MREREGRREGGREGGKMREEGERKGKVGRREGGKGGKVGGREGRCNINPRLLTEARTLTKFRGGIHMLHFASRPNALLFVLYLQSSCSSEL